MTQMALQEQNIPLHEVINVHAYDDGDNPGFSPDGGAGLFFDYPIDLNYSPANPSEEAAITNFILLE